MGFTHGTNWTNEMIKERVMEAVSALELKRMPSRKECSQYFHNESLTNAVSRRMGWYALADELGLPIKDSETYFGKSQEHIAAEQLKARGFEVRQMPQNFPYDLLVNDCVKVDVKVSRLYRGPHGNFYTFNLEKPFCTCDIYMLYLTNDDKSEKDMLVVPSKFVPTNTQISVGEVASKYYKFSQKWRFISEYCDFLEAVI